MNLSPDSLVCLIDGSAFLHRAYAMARNDRDAGGRPIGTIILSARMAAKLARRMGSGKKQPTHVAVLFDPPSSNTWRREIYPPYKAHRPESPEDMKDQAMMVREAWKAVGFQVMAAERHEADDLIATYAAEAEIAGSKTVIVSGDKDLLQLVSPLTMQLDTLKNKWWKEEDVVEKFGVKASLVRDWLAIAGDSADGVPGLPGLGPAAATRILTMFGNLDALLEDPSLAPRPSWEKAFRENREILLMSRRLVTLDSACPLPMNIGDLRPPLWEYADAAADGFINTVRKRLPEIPFMMGS